MPGGWWLKYSPEFRAQALERLKTCDSVSGLARELKISRKWLYLWRERARATEDAQTLEDREKERRRKGAEEIPLPSLFPLAPFLLFPFSPHRRAPRRADNSGSFRSDSNAISQSTVVLFQRDFHELSAGVHAELLK